MNLPIEGVQHGSYLYFYGGYHSSGNGCVAWGTSDRRKSRVLGDCAGYLALDYDDGSEKLVPLVYGYTMWYREIWLENCAPFKQGPLAEVLRGCLSLLGAFEGAETPVLRVDAGAGRVVSARLLPSPDKDGEPVFLRASFDGPGDPFFETHTVTAGAGVPKRALDALQTLRDATLTYEDDFERAPRYDFPDGEPRFRLRFTGGKIADIATGVVCENARNLIDRVDADGFLHTSYLGAPSWRYEGFAPWVENANSYYSDFYSRDGARAILTLTLLGAYVPSERALAFAHDCLDFWRENKLTLGGLPVPGHYTVVVNKQLLYSTVLVPKANWPTRYTKEDFGDEYQNLGNHETDGHGLMMMADAAAWKNASDPDVWARNNFPAIREAASWLIWCFDHPELSLAENGLLYAESEAGMNARTMYCNLACYLGLRGYAELARSIGETECADTWTQYADRHERAMLRGDLPHGFLHDPIAAFWADAVGWDARDIPAGWIDRARKNYPADVGALDDLGHGIGYNLSMAAQTALLLDETYDARRLLTLLAKIAYAPRLPEPYLVPEGVCELKDMRAFKRQGDLGNLVQLAEALKAFAIAAGVSPAHGGMLKLLPRAGGWDIDLRACPVQNAKATVDFAYTLRGEAAEAWVNLEGEGVETVLVRFGPFEKGAKPALALNGARVEPALYPMGDAYWSDATVPAESCRYTDATVSARWLKLPVSYTADPSPVRLYENGKPAYRLDVCLSDKPDCEMYADLRDFVGKTMRFTGIRPEFVQECPRVEPCENRPAAHFTSERGWINDPNGPILYEGQYHLFFQHNPAGPKWGNMHWGHAVSRDMTHWTQREDALFPDDTGTMFSGSAIEDTRNVSGLKVNEHNPLILIYTAAGEPFTQRLAVSVDGGATFAKIGQAVAHIVGNNRDPKIVYDKDADVYRLALYLDGDTYALFATRDLLHYEKTQEITLDGDNECPDLYPLRADDGRRLWALSGAHDRYRIGEFDKDGQFRPVQDVQSLRYAPNSYAAQSFSGLPGGRIARMAWNTSNIENAPFNCAMCTPCEMRLKKIDGLYRLCALPVAEYDALRKPYTADAKAIDLTCALEESMRVKLPGGTIEVTPDAISLNGHTCPRRPSDKRIRAIADTNAVELFVAEGDRYLCAAADPGIRETEVPAAARLYALSL